MAFEPFLQGGSARDPFGEQVGAARPATAPFHACGQMTWDPDAGGFQSEAVFQGAFGAGRAENIAGAMAPTAVIQTTQQQHGCARVQRRNFCESDQIGIGKQQRTIGKKSVGIGENGLQFTGGQVFSNPPTQASDLECWNDAIS